MHGYNTGKVAVTYIVTAPIEICGIIFTRRIIARLKTAASTPDDRADRNGTE